MNPPDHDNPATFNHSDPGSGLDQRLAAVARVEAALDWDNVPDRLRAIAPADLAEADIQIECLARMTADLLRHHHPGFEDVPLAAFREGLIRRATG